MVLRFAVESVSFNRKQAVEMGKLTSPDPPNPRAISSRIKCSTSPYQVEQWKPYTRSIEKIKVIIDHFTWIKRKAVHQLQKK